METKVNKLERENKQLQTKWTEAKDIADKIDDFSNERERIKSELEAVRKENDERRHPCHATHQRVVALRDRAGAHCLVPL